MPTGMVLCYGDEMNTSAYKHSFQKSVKAQMPVESIPAAVLG